MITKNYENYIFDFDGVLVDSKELSFQAINHALRMVRMSPVTRTDFDTKSKIELIREKNIGPLRSLIILFFAKSYFKKNIDQAIPCLEFLETIKKLNSKKLIMSTNSKTNIELALKNDSLIFSKIIGDIGHSKKYKFMQPYAENSLYITDEVRDIEQCHKVGMDVIAVTWGLDSKEKLKQAKPTMLIENPLDLLSLV